MGTQKVLLIRFIPQVQIIFSVLNQIIPRCFNRWNSGFSKCRRMAPYPPHVNTPLSLDITASTHAPTLGGLVCCPYQADAWAGLQYCHRGTDSSVMEQNHPRSAVLSSLPPHSPKIAAAIRQHWGLKTDCDLRCHLWWRCLSGTPLHAPHNLALLRRFAVNALNRAGSSKQSLRQKSKRAAMDDCFMLRVLAAALPDPNEDENPCCQ